MFAFYLSCWSLFALLLQATAAPNITSPQTVEVDLIFPHNDTYAPAKLFPVVFAVQNSHFANLLGLTLSYTIWDASTWNDSTGGTLDLRWDDVSSRDPYFAFDASAYLTDTEGTWKLFWELGGTNCSGSTESLRTFHAESIVENNGFLFKTKKGAQQPNLVAGTGPYACAQSKGFAWNVTDTMDVPFFSDYSDFGLESCAVLSPTSPSPAPSPCQVHISSATASSIKAAMTSEVCKALHPVVSCPPTKDNGASGTMKFPFEGTSWWTAAMGWLAYILI